MKIKLFKRAQSRRFETFKLFAIMIAFCIYNLAVASPEVSSLNKGLYISEEREAEVQKEIVEFVKSFERDFNDGNIEVWNNSSHFPSYRLKNEEMQTINESSIEETKKILGYLRSTGWHRTDYDDFRFIHTSETKVHLDIAFSRYRKDNSLIGRWRSLYILTKENPRWGIKFRSSWATLVDQT